MTGAESLRDIGVAITRAEPPGGPLQERLQRAGARVLHWCAIANAPPEDQGAFAKAVGDLKSYDWMIFASARAVESVVTVLAASHKFLPAKLRIAAVGSGTAAAAQSAGWNVERIGERFSAEGLLESFRASGEAAGTRVLLPGSQLAGPELANGLSRLGAIVEPVQAYRTVPRKLDTVMCRAQVAAGEVDAVTFASPSAVAGLESAFGPSGFRALLRGRIVVSIGPTTTASLVGFGRSPDTEAILSTFDGLVEALVGAVGSRAMNSRKLPGA
ncbi:MAG: uroporphyrinogen-III synthase [Acidobacteriota bacterium]